MCRPWIEQDESWDSEDEDAQRTMTRTGLNIAEHGPGEGGGILRHSFPHFLGICNSVTTKDKVFPLKDKWSLWKLDFKVWCQSHVEVLLQICQFEFWAAEHLTFHSKQPYSAFPWMQMFVLQPNYYSKELFYAYWL